MPSDAVDAVMVRARPGGHDQPRPWNHAGGWAAIELDGHGSEDVRPWMGIHTRTHGRREPNRTHGRVRALGPGRGHGTNGARCSWMPGRGGFRCEGAYALLEVAATCVNGPAGPGFSGPLSANSNANPAELL